MSIVLFLSATVFSRIKSLDKDTRDKNQRPSPEPRTIKLLLSLNRIAIDLHYLPTLEFFAAIYGADEVLLFPNDLYQRQSFMNRTRILLANKVENLSIPIQGRRPKIPVSQVKIDYSQKWQAIHLRGIQSAYGKAPFFESCIVYSASTTYDQDLP